MPAKKIFERDIVANRDPWAERYKDPYYRRKIAVSRILSKTTTGKREMKTMSHVIGTGKITIETLNWSAAEAAANGGKMQEQAVPNTAGARAVVLVRYVIDAGTPDSVASTRTKQYAVLFTGKNSGGTDYGMGADNAVDMATESCYSDATPDVLCIAGANPKTGHCQLPVPKHEDGNYYVCGGTKGASNTGAKTSYFRAEFKVFR
jgi:hypothetical protein